MFELDAHNLPPAGPPAEIPLAGAPAEFRPTRPPVEFRSTRPPIEPGAGGHDEMETIFLPLARNLVMGGHLVQPSVGVRQERREGAAG